MLRQPEVLQSPRAPIWQNSVTFAQHKNEKPLNLQPISKSTCAKAQEFCTEKKFLNVPRSIAKLFKTQFSSAC